MDEMRYLVCCDATGNHNKYYKMTAKGTEFEVEYGRVGAGCQRATYPLSKWNQKYNEKIHKGYQDVTEMRQVVTNSRAGMQTQYTDVTDDSVKALIQQLQAYATQTIKANYTVSSDIVTLRMVNAVSEWLTQLESLSINIMHGYNASIIAEFNRILMEKVYTIIPRRMANVSSNIVSTDMSDYKKVAVRMQQIIEKERDLLNVMKTQVQQQQIETNENTETLEALGIEIKHCTAKDIALIKRELGEDANRLVDAWCVKNKATHKAFEDFKRKNKGDYQRLPIKLLWHGSRNENWWSIINNGLKLSPRGAVITGKMFGQGIYFAPKAHKSLGYTSVPDAYWVNRTTPQRTVDAANVGYMALYATAYGKAYDVNTNSGFTRDFGWYDLQKICPGAHCVHAHAGTALRNDEIIYYNEAQCTIKYIVKIR